MYTTPGKGHTEPVATALAELLGTELQRIETVSESGMFGMRAAIQPLDASLGNVDHLIVATPLGREGSALRQRVSRRACELLRKTVLGARGDEGLGGESAIRAVRNRLTKAGMGFVSTTVTFGDEVDAGTSGRKLEGFAKAILQR